MAMDVRLEAVKEKLHEETTFNDYLEVLKVVAMERGAGVLDYEDPVDCIMEMIEEGDEDRFIEQMLSEYKEIVEALESIGYYDAAKWRKNYESCVKRFDEKK